MPILNGIEATKKIRKYIELGKIQRGVQIIAYTAFNGEEKTCIDAGMDHFCNYSFFIHISIVSKPASYNNIRDILHEINTKLGGEQHLVLSDHQHLI
jgi:CheY-like chemotaxis protein